MQSFIEKYQNIIIRLVIVISVLLALFLIVATAQAVKSYQYVGSGLPAADTITVQGQGKVEKAPDTAKFSFTIQNEEPATASAQAIVSKKIAQVTADLEAAGIASKYITTANYNSYPDYQNATPICTQGTCINGPQTLKGYIVSQNVTISVKDLTKTEMIAGILGKDAVTSIDGPNLGFEDPNSVSNEARAQAIADAKVQAQKLADALGVHLVRIVSFNDNSGNGSPMPVMYNKSMAATTSAPTPPSIPTGVQTITSSVSITYEIR